MTLELILDTLINLHKEIGDYERKTNACKDLPMIEEDFISKLSEELKKEFKSLKFEYNMHIDILNYEDYVKILAFGIKIGLELKEQFDDIIDY